MHLRSLVILGIMPFFNHRNETHYHYSYFNEAEKYDSGDDVLSIDELDFHFYRTEEDPSICSKIIQLLIRGGRVKDSPSVKSHCIQGVKDLLGISDYGR